jgi:hypothetical protein
MESTRLGAQVEKLIVIGPPREGKYEHPRL